MGSILKETKVALGLDPDAEGYDPELIIFINGVLSDMHQLDVGPEEGFKITGATQEWDAFLGPDPRLDNAKTYLHLCVKLLFDPPQTGPLGLSIEKLRDRAEWRLTVAQDEIKRPPVPRSGVAFVNPLGRPAVVSVLGGKVLSIDVDGAPITNWTTPFVVLPDQPVTLTYTQEPTWRWI